MVDVYIDAKRLLAMLRVIKAAEEYVDLWDVPAADTREELQAQYIAMNAATLVLKHRIEAYIEVSEANLPRTPDTPAS